jgi:ribonuclease P protein component
VARPEFVLYHFAREAPEVPRVGFAVGRRIGGAVVRNRTRRRLREAIRPLIPRLAACDIVIVARSPALQAGVRELETAIADAVARAGLLRT